MIEGEGKDFFSGASRRESRDAFARFAEKRNSQGSLKLVACRCTNMSRDTAQPPNCSDEELKSCELSFAQVECDTAAWREAFWLSRALALWKFVWTRRVVSHSKLVKFDDSFFRRDWGE